MQIYYAKIDGLHDALQREKALQMLPKVRRDKILHIKQEKDRLRSMMAGLLLEYTLREYGLSGKNIVFLKNADGKPYLAEYPSFHYNLSHSGDYAAIAVSNQTVGIDIEYVRTNQKRLVQRFFSKEECAMLEEEWSDLAFTRIWTRKESYIKAVGFGMRMPLAGFSTVAETVTVNEHMNSEMLDEVGELFYLESFWIGEACSLSVCQKGSAIDVIPKELNIKELLVE